MDTSETVVFALIQTVADGWEAGPRSGPTDCFAEDAACAELRQQLYLGRKAIYAFFGGPPKSSNGNEMAPHVNSQEQVGPGEYAISDQH